MTLRDALLLLIGTMSGVAVGALFFTWLAKAEGTIHRARYRHAPRIRTEITWRD